MHQSESLDGWRWLAALAIALGLLGLAPGARALDQTYAYDDSLMAGGPFAGSGVFTLTIGAPLGDYPATDVSGSGDSFGVWKAVEFHASAGGLASLVISNLVGGSIGLSFPAIGGGVIEAGSQADLEWDHFLDTAERLGLRITPLSTAVPETSTWVGAAAVCVVGAAMGSADAGSASAGTRSPPLPVRFRHSTRIRGVTQTLAPRSRIPGPGRDPFPAGRASLLHRVPAAHCRPRGSPSPRTPSTSSSATGSSRPGRPR